MVPGYCRRGVGEGEGVGRTRRGEDWSLDPDMRLVLVVPLQYAHGSWLILFFAKGNDRSADRQGRGLRA